MQPVLLFFLKKVYIYIYWQHFFINKNFVKHNRYCLSTYFFVDPFILPYCFYRIRRESIDIFSIIVYIPSTFCPTLGHHQGRIYYKSYVTFVFAYYYYVRVSDFNLSRHEITSVFKSAVILWAAWSQSFKYVYFWRHFFINTNFVEHDRHFLSRYFLLDPFVLLYCFYRIRQELIDVFSIIVYIPNTTLL